MMCSHAISLAVHHSEPPRARATSSTSFLSREPQGGENPGTMSFSRTVPSMLFTFFLNRKPCPKATPVFDFKKDHSSQLSSREPV